MQNLRSEIATKEAPGGAIVGRVDVVLVAASDFGDGGRWGSVGESGAVLDEGLVSEGAIGDEDDGGRAYFESDDGAQLGVERAYVGFQFGERFSA